MLAGGVDDWLAVVTDSGGAGLVDGRAGSVVGHRLDCLGGGVMAVLDMAATREMSAFDNLPYEVRGALQINGASAILSRSMLKAGLPELDLVLMLENTDAYEFEDFVNSSKRNRKQ